MASLIFVAVAVAWALYLIPKALQSHEHATRARSVERFSHTMRVLARREPVDHRRSRLVVPGRSGAVTASSLADAAAEGAPASAPQSAEAAAPAVVLSPAQVRAHREAAKRAAKDESGRSRSAGVKSFSRSPGARWSVARKRATSTTSIPTPMITRPTLRPRDPRRPTPA